MQLVDIHHHLIYGVDDGPRTFEETQAMLLKAHENGISDVFATSHATPGQEPFPADVYLPHVEKAQAWANEQNLGITIRVGCEIFYTDAAVRLVQEGYIPTLDYSHHVLVEFGLRTPESMIMDAVEKFGIAGYNVIMAHIERYKAMRSMKLLKTLHDDYGVLMQMNARTVYEKHGFLNDLWARKVLDNGYIDMIGTDAHNTSSRACNMKECYEYLCSRYDESYANKLCGGNQRRILHLNEQDQP